MKPYFFIPSSKLHKINSIEIEDQDSIIIDFEDSILNRNKELYLDQLKEIQNFNKYWVRVPLRGTFDENIDFKFLSKTVGLGVNKIMLPKLISIKELSEITDRFPHCKFIVLVEHPRLLFEIHLAFFENDTINSQVVGIGLGSHDLATFMNFKDDSVGMNYPKMKLLYLCKAYNIAYIDVASMNIYDEIKFCDQLNTGYDLGCDGKFLIHPNQLKWLNEFLQNKNKEKIDWAAKVVSKLPVNYNINNIEPFIFEGQVIEKPHVIMALDILNKQ